MRAALEKINSGSLYEKPFPHLVIDNFIDEESANELADICKIKANSTKVIRHTNNITDNKIECREDLGFEKTFVELEDILRSDNYISRVKKMLSIEEVLIADTELFGSGIHCLPPKGMLGMHLDFRNHPRTGLCRRLNSILYMNKGYKEEHGGMLEIAQKSSPSIRKTIKPEFNRLVIFPTNDFTLHGVPKRIPVDAPNRYSIAYYHYSETRPKSDVDPMRNYESTWYESDNGFKGTLIKLMRIKNKLMHRG